MPARLLVPDSLHRKGERGNLLQKTIPEGTVQAGKVIPGKQLGELAPMLLLPRLPPVRLFARLLLLPRMGSAEQDDAELLLDGSIAVATVTRLQRER